MATLINSDECNRVRELLKELHFLEIGMIKLRLPILFIALLSIFVAGCVLPTVERYTPLQTGDYTKRKQPAEKYDGSPVELFEKGYLLLGYMDYTINVQTCYNDSTCDNHANETDISTSLMSSAAARGADKVIVLSTKLDLVPKTKSVCTSFSTSSYTDKDGNVHTSTICIASQSYEGHLEAWQKRALLFRYEPQADNTEKNYTAVKKAVDTIDGGKTGEAPREAVGATGEMERNLKAAGQGLDDYGAQLIAAIDAGNVEFLQKQLQGEALDAWERKNKINLLMIAYVRNAKVASSYLETQPRKWLVNTSEGYNAYHAAIRFSDVGSLQQLESHHPYLIGKDRDFIEKLLFSAGEASNSAVIPYLKTKSYDFGMKLGQEECTVLHHAAIQGNLPVVEALLKAGANIEAKCRGGSTPLMLASLRQQPDAMKYLVSLGANIPATDLDGNSLLHFAAAKSSKETLNYALSLPELSVQKKNGSGVDACVVAISEKNWQAVAPLIDHGALCKFPDQQQSAAALGVLLREGSPEALTAYLKRTELLDNPYGGATEAIGSYCAEVCSQEKMEAILELGLPLHRYYSGATLLHIARTKKNDGAMVAILRRTYSDPKQLSEDSMLKEAVIGGDSALVSAIRHAQGHSF